MVCGQSMGAALAVLLSDSHPEIPALALLAPFIGMNMSMRLKISVSRLLRFAWSYANSSGGERSLHDPAAMKETLGARVITADSISPTSLIKTSRMPNRGAMTAPGKSGSVWLMTLGGMTFRSSPE